MDCKNFEKLILDYIDGKLDKEMTQICNHHLSHCPDCSELNENYKSIRTEIKRVEEESPSAEILQSIREHAKEQGIIKKTPFYKKWFYSPILVPAVAAAATLLVVIYTGDEYMNREELADKSIQTLNSEDNISENKIAERDLLAGDQKKNSVPETEDDTVSHESGNEPEDPDKYAAVSSLKEESSEIPATPERSVAKSEEARNSYTNAGKLQRDETVSASAVSNLPEDDTSYRRQLNKVTLLQYQGNCRESIKEADKLLNSEPVPPLRIQKNAYTAQAECYEETGQYSKAIDVYRKILEIEPKVNTEISSKIRELNNKIQQ